MSGLAQQPREERGAMSTKIEWTATERLLYRAVRELNAVDSVENCHSGLCKSCEGRAIVEDGMKLLGIADLSGERLEDCPQTHPKGWQPGEVPPRCKGEL